MLAYVATIAVSIIVIGSIVAISCALGVVIADWEPGRYTRGAARSWGHCRRGLTRAWRGVSGLLHWHIRRKHSEGGELGAPPAALGELEGYVRFGGTFYYWDGRRYYRLEAE